MQACLLMGSRHTVLLNQPLWHSEEAHGSWHTPAQEGSHCIDIFRNTPSRPNMKEPWENDGGEDNPLGSFLTAEKYPYVLTCPSHRPPPYSCPPLLAAADCPPSLYRQSAASRALMGWVFHPTVLTCTSRTTVSTRRRTTNEIP